MDRITALTAADDLRAVWGALLDAHQRVAGVPVPAEAQASALVSLLLNHFIRELQHTDCPTIRQAMHRLADRLLTLADTPAAQLDAVAQFLADEPRQGITRQ